MSLHMVVTSISILMTSVYILVMLLRMLMTSMYVLVTSLHMIDNCFRINSEACVLLCW